MRTAALSVTTLIASFAAHAAPAQQPAPQPQSPQSPPASTQAPAGRAAETEPRHRPYRIVAAFAGDAYSYETDRSNLDDDGQAGMLRLQFEGLDKKGHGLGVRYEGLASDDEFFDEAGFVDTRVTSHTVFGHFTTDLGSGDFRSPLRFGGLINLQRLEEQGTPNDVDYLSIGPYVEIAPEYWLVNDDKFRWSLYGEFGVGIGGTDVDVDNDAGDYLTWTAFAGAEVGTRFGIGLVEIGAAYILRWQSMDQSGPDNGQVAFAYYTDFQGVLVSLGVRF